MPCGRARSKRPSSSVSPRVAGLSGSRRATIGSRSRRPRREGRQVRPRHHAQKLRSLDSDGQITALQRSQAVIAFDPTGTILDANQNFLEQSAIGSTRSAVGITACSWMHRAGGTAYRGFWDRPGQGRVRRGRVPAHRQGRSRGLDPGDIQPHHRRGWHRVQGGEVRRRHHSPSARPPARVEVQRSIGADLDAIGTAVEAVTRQTAEAAGTVGQVSSDIQAVASGAEENCRHPSARSASRSATRAHGRRGGRASPAYRQHR